MFKSMLHSLVTKGLVALLNFVLLIISARYLGASTRGEISIFILNLAIVQIISEVYTGYTLVYFVPRVDLRKLFLSGLLYCFIVCSLCNGAIACLHRQVQGFEWLGYVISVLVILNTFNSVLILAKEMLRFYNFLCLLQPFLLLAGLLLYILAYKDVTFRAYVYPLLLSFSIAIIFSGAVVLRFVFKKRGAAFALKPILTNGFFSQAAILMYIFCKRYSYYLLDDTAEVGLYSSAVLLTESVLVIVTAISPVLLSRLANRENSARSTGLVLSISKACMAVSALAVLIIALIPGNFFVLVLGPGFAGTKHLMLLYAPAVLMASFFGILSGYFSAIGKQGVVLLCHSIGFVFALVLTPFLVQHYQAEGAAYATFISYFVIAVATGTVFFKATKLPFKRLFLVKEDLENLKTMVGMKQG